MSVTPTASSLPDAFITQEEFDVMEDELLHQKQTRYDMLCKIARKFLTRKVKSWCKNTVGLKGVEPDDVMQSIYLHLIKVTVDKFFLKKNDDGSFRFARNPGVFGKWLNTVAKNKFTDMLEKSLTDAGNMDYMEEDEFNNLSTSDISDDATVDKLKEAFSTVLNSGAGIYIILSWLALNLVHNVGDQKSRISAQDVVIRDCENMPLFEMYEYVVKLAKEVPWLEISYDEHRKILAALQKPFDADRCYGEARYHEFFMKDRGVPSAKKSISNWVNRMDGEAEQALNDESDGKIKNKRKRKPGSETSGCGDTSSQ